MKGLRDPDPTYLRVIRDTELASCFPDDLPRNAAVYEAACIEAAVHAPIDWANPMKTRREHVIQRLHEALAYRNKWYRDTVKAGN